MARKAPENIKKKQVDFLQRLKLLTKWLTNNRRTDEQLIELIDKFKIENNSIKRILSYNYTFPYIIHYFNKYMNSIYGFESLDTKVLIRSVSYLMDVNNRSNNKCFMYIKSNDLKDEIKKAITDLIKEHMRITYNIHLCRRDLDIYYKLFRLGVIKDEELLMIDKTLNPDKPLIKSLNIANFQEALSISDLDENPEVETTFSPEIINFINSMKTEKQTREECKQCALYSKPIVVLDTNTDKLGDVDIAFIGLNAGTEEVKADKPFVGEYGKPIRDIISQIPKDKKWVIFNVILCNTPSKSELDSAGGANSIIRNCIGFVSKIFQNFPSKLFIPVGDDAKSVFGIAGKITEVSGKLFEKDNDVKVIPLIHPNSISKNSKYQSIFDSSAKNILSMFGIKEEPKTRTATNAKINESLLVNDVIDLLLVDTKRIENNKVLMIFTDHAGNKKYQIKDFNFPILIKNKEWNECNMTTDKVDDNCFVNDYQRSQILRKCHQLMKERVDL